MEPYPKMFGLVTVCVKSGHSVRQPDRGAKIRCGCLLTRDARWMVAGTRPPAHGPGRAAHGPRPSMRGQLRTRHASRPPASCALGVCDPGLQTASQTQTRHRRALQLGESITAHGPRSGQLGRTFKDQGPRPTGPDLTENRTRRPAGRAESLRRPNAEKGTPWAGPVYAGEKKPPRRAARRPSWARAGKRDQATRSKSSPACDSNSTRSAVHWIERA